MVGEDLYDYVSGEFRYVYHDGHPFLGSGSARSEIQGQSHTLTYDIVAHAKPRESRLRPFVAAGWGAKGYIIAGPAPTMPALTNVGSLTTRDEWHLVVDVGGGLKYRLTRYLLVRVDFRDYMTTFPKRQIAPAPGNTSRGIFQQFTVLPGVSCTF